MESTQVVIVGAGPAGLVLALSLAAFNVRSVILEKEEQIITDPRGVFLTGDAVRILYNLGLGEKINYISHVHTQVHFHETTFSARPFFSLNTGNTLHQAVPEGILHVQPRLEAVLREKVEATDQCQLRVGCTVTKRLSEDPPEIEYVNGQGGRKRIRAEWLVGADGKTGVVRKQFLEPTAGIKQVQGTYRYEGTWIAANLRISLPTPDSHPTFPLWKLGYTPAQVYDLFWPQGWHFCSPPGKPTASGRFGPYDERLWRHEFREDCANADTDCEDLLWDHLRPMISLWRDNGEGREFEQAISYPQDCIEVLRCKPFTFTHKVVNRWFEKRTILIGDAAHVFPPFAGQGIGSGFRDAHQLAWRLALLVSTSAGDASPPPSHTALGAILRRRDRLLNSWERERLASVDDAAYFSMLVGTLCNKKPSLGIHLALKLQTLLEWCSFLPPSYWHPLSRKERQGFAGVRDGFHLQRFGGGIRLAQIWLRSFPDNTLCLSDTLLRLSPSALTVFAIANGGSNVGEIYGSAAECIAGADLEAHILRKKPVIIARESECNHVHYCGGEAIPIYLPYRETSSAGLMQVRETQSSDVSAFFSCFGGATLFVIARSDCFSYALAQNVTELARILSGLRRELMS